VGERTQTEAVGMCWAGIFQAKFVGTRNQGLPQCVSDWASTGATQL